MNKVPNITAMQLPSALEHYNDIACRTRDHTLLLFLDYDGTLTPIVKDPEAAEIDEECRQLLRILARHYRVAIISGRDLADVRQKVGITELYYAGSHGFDIAGPAGLKKQLTQAQQALPELEKAQQALLSIVKRYEGAQLESKSFSLAIHFRNVENSDKQKLCDTIVAQCREYQGLRLQQGKEVFNLSPAIDWHKGKAVRWLQKQMDGGNSSLPLYIGDDITDEDAFQEIGDDGVSILVRDEERETHAHYALDSPEEVYIFLSHLLKLADQ